MADDKSRNIVNSGGGPVFMGNVKNSGTITGTQNSNGVNVSEVEKLFDILFTRVDKLNRLSTDDKNDLKQEIEDLRLELAKHDEASEGFLMRRLRNIKRMAPDILDVTLTTITSPVAGFGLIAKKVAEKIKLAAD